MAMNPKRYTFGTGSIAAERLQYLNDFFNPGSRAFIAQILDKSANTIIDLGCGPGFTTNMLYEVTNCPNIYGFDNAGHFIELAKNNFENLNFIKCDVTDVPFLVKADAIYSRFLLSHFEQIEIIVNNWINQLNTNGILLIDEMENIETDIDVFNRYLVVNNGLVKSQNANLYIGNVLNNLTYQAENIYNKCDAIRLKNWEAATLFYMNTISIWENEPYVLDILSDREKKEISDELLSLKNNKTEKSSVTWKMRRIALKK